MAPATQKKKKPIVDTSNAKIDSYFKPQQQQKQVLLRKTLNINENADCNDENKKPPTNSQSSSQGGATKKQTTLSLTTKPNDISTTATKRQFGAENGSNCRQFGEIKRLKTPSPNNSQPKETTKRRENDIPIPSSTVDIKSRAASENIGLINPKHDENSKSRQPLKEKEIKPLRMNKPSFLSRKSAPTHSTFQVHCDDDDNDNSPLDTPLPTATTTLNSLSGGGLREITTQYIPTQEEEEIGNTQATQMTHVTVTSSPVDLSYQHEFEDDNDQLFVYRDNEQEEPLVNVYRDENSDSEEGSSFLFPKTESTNIKLKPVIVEEEDDDDTPPELPDIEDEEPITTRKSFFSDNEEEEEEEDSNSTIDNFFRNEEEEEEEEQNKKSSLDQDLFIFEMEEEFSVGNNPSLTLEPGSSLEPIKEYHRPYPVPRGRDLFEKYDMVKPEQEEQEEEEDYLLSSQKPSQERQQSQEP